MGSVGGGWGPNMMAYLSTAGTGLIWAVETDLKIRGRYLDPTVARLEGIGGTVFIAKIGWAIPVCLPETSTQPAIPEEPGGSSAIDNDPDRGRAIGVLYNIGGLMIGKVDDDIRGGHLAPIKVV